jgi:hypothetical protein
MIELLLCLIFTPDIQALGSDDFVTRERAQRRLDHYSLLSRWACRCGCRSQDLEIRRRSCQILRHTLDGAQRWGILSERFGPISYEWHRNRPLPDKTWFVITHSPLPPKDCYLAWVYRSNHPVARWYLERARTGYAWQDWLTPLEQREASRLLARDLEALGVPLEVSWLWLGER